jgi:hypothetical protein
MDNQLVRERVQKLLNQEQEYLKRTRLSPSGLTRQSDIDYGMGKIRAYEQVLGLLEPTYQGLDGHGPGYD